MEDGLVLFYVKDGTLYPVMLTKEQNETFEIIKDLIPSPLHVAFDKPQGKVVNLVKPKE